MSLSFIMVPTQSRRPGIFTAGNQLGKVINVLQKMALCAALTGASVVAVATTRDGRELADLSLEELSTLKVTSVSKTAESLSDAPASIHVITGAEIQRTGVTSLPEALRLAPNLQVARFDAANYGITARGFNGLFANKMLVMIDGRTVYSPLFSGVFWDVQDVVLEDVERIEVVSGPGATLWGANAVNGVISVTSRSAAETQGTLLSVGASPLEHQATARYGGELGDGHYRVYMKSSTHDDIPVVGADLSGTGWHRTHTGFRSDWGDVHDGFTLQGDAYRGRLGQLYQDEVETSGVHLLGRMRRQLAQDSALEVQAYFDHTERDQPGLGAQDLNVFDLEFHHAVKPNAAHNVVWGGGYRRARDHVVSDTLHFMPEKLTMNWANIFVQDEIELRDDIRLTLGTKLEKNPYTGWEYLPNLRMAWIPSSSQLVWTAVSRAVRSPSRIDRDLYVPGFPAGMNGEPNYLIAGGPDFVSEVAKVVELGYRAQPVSSASYSLTLFHTNYEQLKTQEYRTQGFGLEFSNKARATSYGLEMWGSWQATSRWRLRGGVTAQDIDIELEPESSDEFAKRMDSNDPSVYWMLRSSYDFSNSVQLDATFRHVNPLEDIPDYQALDLRLAWDITPELEISVTGQNLLDQSHAEISVELDRYEFERAVFWKVIWRQ